MLQKVLKLDQVHIFGDISESQLKEKMDFVAEIAIANDLNKAHGPKQLTFITVISLARNGLLAESEQIHKALFERKVDQYIPVANDFSCPYKNFSRIEWHSAKNDKTQSEIVSMIELTSRITNITTAMLLLFQILFAQFSNIKSRMSKYI